MYDHDHFQTLGTLLAVDKYRGEIFGWTKRAYSTMYSQAVTHPSTNMAQCCLTSVIGRELVCST